MERLQTGQDRSSTSKVIRLNTVPAGQRYAMVMPSYFSRLSMLNAKKPSPHHHDMQGKTILAFRRIVLYKTMGGTERAENRVLIHPNCHRQVHAKGLTVSKPRPVKTAPQAQPGALC